VVARCLLLGKLQVALVGIATQEDPLMIDIGGLSLRVGTVAFRQSNHHAGAFVVVVQMQQLNEHPPTHPHIYTSKYL
jgi:hypothetical protein